MESITHTPGHDASPRKQNRTNHSSSDQAPDQIRGFHYDARRAALGYDYLRRKWLPREGPLFYAFIQVMRSHCYHNPHTGEVRETCWPKVETIAKECGVDPATIHRLIQRDKTTGEFNSKHAEALRRFIKIQPRWLWNEKTGHKVQRSSIYLVALDDPPVPEEDHLVDQKEDELATILTMEQVRQQRQTASPADSEAESTDLQNASLLTLAKCESVMSRKMPDKSLPVTLTNNPYLDRTKGERSSAGKSIGNQENAEKALVGGKPEGSATGVSPSPRSPTGRARRASAQGKQVKESAASPRAQALAHARAVTGATIGRALRELGGSNPEGGAQTILEAFVDVGAPLECLQACVALGQQRLAQQQELTTIPNPTGYLISILRHLAVEAMLKGWNIEQMRAEDAVKHAQALRSKTQRETPLLPQEGHSCPGEEESPGARSEQHVQDGCLPAVSDPAASLPEGVTLAGAARAAAWRDHLPDPETGQLRAVSMLWGFVRDAIRERLNVARRSQLEALIPKWDEARPRTLLLVCNLTYTARAFELYLRREIEPQLGKLLSHFFDEVQVVYVPVREQEEAGV
jgi:hypothetical protein